MLCILKFQDDLINQEFFIRLDCRSAKDVLQKDVLQKDVKILASKYIYSSWQALLSTFNFQIKHQR